MQGAKYAARLREANTSPDTRVLLKTDLAAGMASLPSLTLVSTFYRTFPTSLERLRVYQRRDDLKLESSYMELQGHCNSLR